MRIIVGIAIALTLAGCGDPGPEPSALQQQQMQRSFYGPGNPSLTSPAQENAPVREPVPGEQVPDR
jgi:hypothetical protein